MQSAEALVCCLIALAAALVFRQTLGFDFVNFDDDVYVTENPHLGLGLTPQGVAWALSTTHASNWHPVAWLSLLLDYELFGPAPWGYHLGNVLLHVAAAVTLFLVLRRMTGDLWPSAFAAALFAVHPLRAESVAWVSERKDVLSGLFFMLTLGAYWHYVRRPFSWSTPAPGCADSLETAEGGRSPMLQGYPRTPAWIRYLTVVLLFALGLMAKPMLVTLPFVLLLLDYWPLGRKISFWRLAAEKLPLLFLSAVSCVVTPLAQSAAYVRLDLLPLSARMENALVSYAAYLGQFLYPVGLAVYYPHSEGDLPSWQIAGAAALLAGLTAGAVFCRKRHPWLLVGWFWYLGMLVPVIGIVQVGGHAMADRYTYLPQIGLAIALTWEARRLVNRLPGRAWTCGIVASLVIAVLMGSAWRQTSYWRNSETLWKRALDCTARNALAHQQLGAALQHNGHAAEAAEQFQKALKLAPNHPVARNNLGLALYDLGRMDEAVVHLRRAIELNSRYPEAHFNLGNTLAGLKKPDEAMAEYRIALDMRPDYADARFNLGVVLYQNGRAAEAIDEWEKVIRANPDHAAALDRLAWALAAAADASIRDGPRAVELAERAARLVDGRDPGVLYTLAAAYAESGRFPEALKSARLAVILAREQENPTLAETIESRIEPLESGRPVREPSSL